jgi:alkylated DNA repair dioxygenase AlkB
MIATDKKGDTNMKKLTSKSSVAEVKGVVAEIHQICEQYDFWNREVHPYSFKMIVRELVESNGWRDYEHYTSSSKSIIRQEINGFANILEHWVEYENEPMIKIHYLTGKKVGQTEEVHESLAEIFVQTQMAELV